MKCSMCRQRKATVHGWMMLDGFGDVCHQCFQDSTRKAKKPSRKSRTEPTNDSRQCLLPFMTEAAGVITTDGSTAPFRKALSL